MNNLPVVYTVRIGDDNKELRYSLRSLSNVPHGDVWIVGYKPTWVKNVNHIPTRLISRNKIANTDENWYRFALNPATPDEFILMNDDMFINNQILEIKQYYIGKHIKFLKDYVKNSPRSYYTKVIADTHARLALLGYYEPLCYELHVPMVVRKSDILKALDGQNYRYVPVNIRSLVGNIGNYGGTKLKDPKVYFIDETVDKYIDSDFISTTDKTFAQSQIGKYLREKFDTKSDYEV